MKSLIVEDLHVAVEGKEIIRGVDLEIKEGETHAIMGPNGSGKSTLSFTIAGHPKYEITQGRIFVRDGEDEIELNEMTPDARAKAGIFLAAQLPTEVEGVSLTKFLRASVGAVQGELPPIREWVKTLEGEMAKLEIDPSFASRYLNVGFSGGEKKRTEILQLRLLKPSFAILDETDSGLDVDALKIVAQGVNEAQKEFGFGSLLITHHTHLLEYIQPDFVHVFAGGKIVQTGSYALAQEIVVGGYKGLV